MKMKLMSLVPGWVAGVLAPVILAGTLCSGGCGNKTEPTPSSLEAQQKGVMGGTPPPDERAKIAAFQATEEKKTATGQARQKGGK